MFDPHRHKAAVLVAVGDVILTILTFEAAYQTRVFLPLERVFFILTPIKALLLGVTLALWLLAGRWIGVYERLYGTNVWAATYDSFRQVLVGTLGLVVFQFLLRLDVSRSFIGLFALYNFGALVALPRQRRPAERLYPAAVRGGGFLRHRRLQRKGHRLRAAARAGRGVRPSPVDLRRPF